MKSASNAGGLGANSAQESSYSSNRQGRGGTGKGKGRGRKGSGAIPIVAAVVHELPVEIDTIALIALLLLLNRHLSS